jgi:hypothetical protein
MKRYRSTQCIASILHEMFSIRRHLMNHGEVQEYPVYSQNAAPDVLNKAAYHD